MSKGIFKHIFSDTLVYGITKYLSVAASIFLTPIYTRLLSKEDFGIMDVFNTWNTMIIAILPLGLYNAILRFYPDVKEQPDEKRKVLGSILCTLLLTTGLYVIGILLFKNTYFRLFEGTAEQQAVFYYSILIVFLAVFHAYFLQLLQVKFQKYKYLTVTFTNFVVLTFLGFYLVYGLGEGITGFFKASCIALSMSNLIALFYTAGDLHFSFDISRIRKLLTYSVHFVTVFFLFQLSNVIDRFLINSYLDLSQVGVYSVAMRIGNFLQIAIGSFGTAWMPYAMSVKSHESSKELYSKMMELYVLALSAVIALLLLFRKEIILFFAPAYMDCYDTISWILLFNFVMGLVFVFTLGIQITKKSRFLSIAAVFSIFCNLLISLLLIGRFGINGVAAGSVAGAVVWIGIQHYFSQKYYPVNFRYLRTLAMMAWLIVPLLLSNYLDHSPSSTAWNITIKAGTALLILAFIFLYFLKNKSIQKMKEVNWK